MALINDHYAHHCGAQTNNIKVNFLHLQHHISMSDFSGSSTDQCSENDRLNKCLNLKMELVWIVCSSKF